MRYFKILLISLLLFSLKVNSQSVQAVIENFVLNQEYKNAIVSVVVKDITNNKILGEFNSNYSVIPASITKLFTTAAAIEILGADYTFKTDFQYSGKIVDSVLYGNIYVKGYGDPSLGSVYFTNSKVFLKKIIEKLQKIGIKKIEGNLVSDYSYYEFVNIPQTWIWGDFGNYYGSVPSAICFSDNIYTIDYNSTDSSKKNPEISEISPTQDAIFINKLSKNINEGDKSLILGFPYSNYRFLYGSIPQNKNSFKVKGAMISPGKNLCKALSEEMQISNIKFNGNIYDYFGFEIDTIILNKIVIDSLRKNLFSETSPSVKELILKTNHKSINLFAEHLCIEIGKKVKNIASIESGVEALNEFWNKKGITDGLFLRDGSGLSRFTAFTANNMIALLEYMDKKSSNKIDFYNSLPIASKSGTISNMFDKFKDAEKIHAKTGSMERARSLAGYIELSENKKIAFVVMLNNYSHDGFKARKDIENLIIQIYSTLSK